MFLKFLFIAISAILLAISLFFLLPAYSNLRHTREKSAELEKKFEQKQAECLELRQLFSDLESNPKAVEKIAREKFSLCRKDEIIYIYKMKDAPKEDILPELPAEKKAPPKSTKKDSKGK